MIESRGLARLATFLRASQSEVRLKLTAGGNRYPCAHDHDDFALLVQDLEKQIERLALALVKVTAEVQMTRKARLWFSNSPLLPGWAIVVGLTRALFHVVRER